MMRQQGTIVFWFCTGAALILALYGGWNYMAGTPNPISLGCLEFATVFLAAGALIRWTARRAERKADVIGNKAG